MYGLFIKRMTSCSTQAHNVNKFKQFYPSEYGLKTQESTKRPVTNLKKKVAIKNEKVLELINQNRIA